MTPLDLSVPDILGPMLLGFLSGASLIVAIGAQNAFVLRQGLRREHVLAVVAVCALSDAALIVAGVAGIGVLVETAPVVLDVVRWVGAAFLIGYALFAARRALRPARLIAGKGQELTLLSAILTCAALTWLNPHVYLDTILLLGSLAAPHGDTGRWLFGAGAVVASLAWFTALGYGSRLLSRFFVRPAAWRVLDASIAVVMLALGILLLVMPY